MMVYICVKFHQNIWNGFQLKEWSQVHSTNGYFQYLLCSKGCNSKSRLARDTVFVFCMLSHGEKFHQNIWNSFQLTKRTRIHGRNGYVQCSKGNNSKSRQTRVMVHVFCISSHNALHLCEVFCKYLERFSTYKADRSTW